MYTPKDKKEKPGNHTTTRMTESKTIPSKNASPILVQAKLEVTDPGDSYEQEADSMADIVMRKASTPSGVPPPSGLPSQFISRVHSSHSSISVSPSLESSILSHKGGFSMPSVLRSKMETSFGADFSSVRFHTGAKAADMSSSLHAKAFTYRNDIYFNVGQYNPDTKDGQRLIAHELAHTLQQGNQVSREWSEEDKQKLMSDDSVPTFIKDDTSLVQAEDYFQNDSDVSDRLKKIIELHSYIKEDKHLAILASDLIREYFEVRLSYFDSFLRIIDDMRESIRKDAAASGRLAHAIEILNERWDDSGDLHEISWTEEIRKRILCKLKEYSIPDHYNEDTKERIDRENRFILTNIIKIGKGKCDNLDEFKKNVWKIKAGYRNYLTARTLEQLKSYILSEIAEYDGVKTWIPTTFAKLDYVISWDETNKNNYLQVVSDLNGKCGITDASRIVCDYVGVNDNESLTCDHIESYLHYQISNIDTVIKECYSGGSEAVWDTTYSLCQDTLGNEYCSVLDNNKTDISFLGVANIVATIGIGVLLAIAATATIGFVLPLAATGGASALAVSTVGTISTAVLDGVLNEIWTALDQWDNTDQEEFWKTCQESAIYTFAFDMLPVVGKGIGAVGKGLGKATRITGKGFKKYKGLIARRVELSRINKIHQAKIRRQKELQRQIQEAEAVVDRESQEARSAYSQAQGEMPRLRNELKALELSISSLREHIVKIFGEEADRLSILAMEKGREVDSLIAEADSAKRIADNAKVIADNTRRMADAKKSLAEANPEAKQIQEEAELFEKAAEHAKQVADDLAQKSQKANEIRDTEALIKKGIDDLASEYRGISDSANDAIIKLEKEHGIADRKLQEAETIKNPTDDDIKLQKNEAASAQKKELQTIKDEIPEIHEAAKKKEREIANLQQQSIFQNDEPIPVNVKRNALDHASDISNGISIKDVGQSALNATLITLGLNQETFDDLLDKEINGHSSTDEIDKSYNRLQEIRKLENELQSYISIMEIEVNEAELKYLTQQGVVDEKWRQHQENQKRARNSNEGPSNAERKLYDDYLAECALLDQVLKHYYDIKDLNNKKIQDKTQEINDKINVLIDNTTEGDEGIIQSILGFSRKKTLSIVNSEEITYGRHQL